MATPSPVAPAPAAQPPPEMDETFLPFFKRLDKIFREIPLSEALRILAHAAQDAEEVLKGCH